MAFRFKLEPFARLAYDTSGNALAIMAAALFPMVGLVGGAVDMSRLYLVKTRLQQACDAGVLAGRRVMVGTSVVADPNAMTQAQNFFQINLANGAYGARNVALAVADVREGGVPTGNLTGRVYGTATASVPMTLMRVFGNETIDMTARCEANLNIANNDIMFVLDLTGSMACLPTDSVSQCQAYTNSSTGQVRNVGGVWQTPAQAGSRIGVLRDAVSQFFTTVNSATPPSARLRIGFLPYSSNVKVGSILPTGSLLTTSHNYITRAAEFTLSEHTPGTTSYGAWGNSQTYGYAITSANCDSYGANRTFSHDGLTFNPTAPAASSPPTARITGGATPGAATNTQYRRVSWTGANATNKTCVRERRTGTTRYTTLWKLPESTDTNRTNREAARFTLVRRSINIANTTLPMVTLWDDDPATREALQRAARVSVPVPSGSEGYDPQQLAAMVNNGTAFNMTASLPSWDGCIEEREVNDDVDGAANSDATRWRPAWYNLTFLTTTTPATPANTFYSCSMGARRLATVTQADVDNYVADPRFVAHGGTYHDIGMIWGTRIMSKNGVFGADHTAAANGRDVKRHIIFMTDGDMAPSEYVYGSYGIEAYDKRIVGTGGDSGAVNLKARHNVRFLAACQAAKDREISVWVVAFGQALTTELTTCADSGQAFQANNATELQVQFQQIAQRIAELRLSK